MKNIRQGFLKSVNKKSKVKKLFMSINEILKQKYKVSRKSWKLCLMALIQVLSTLAWQLQKRTVVLVAENDETETSTSNKTDFINDDDNTSCFINNEETKFQMANDNLEGSETVENENSVRTKNF